MYIYKALQTTAVNTYDMLTLRIYILYSNVLVLLQLKPLLVAYFDS